MGWFSDFLKGTGKAAGQAAVESFKLTAVMAMESELERLERGGARLSPRELDRVVKAHEHMGKFINYQRSLPRAP